jgi:anti-sigma regulatory factor (Ser/Thr protein kinase)
VNTLQLRHDAFIYGSDDEFVSRMSDFIEEGLDEGAATIAVTTRSNWAGLRHALGSRASEVRYTDRDSFYVRPAKAIAAYDATVRQNLEQGAQSVRVIGEVQFGPTNAEWCEWTAYEAIVNSAFADLPAWIVCPYDTRELPEEVLQSAWRTHVEVVGDGTGPRDHYEDPAQLARALTPEYEALPLLRGLAPVADAHAFREALAVEMAAARLPELKRLDMLVAANEAFANASLHGGGVTRVRTGVVEGRFVCEITDSGPGLDDPLAGYLPPKQGAGRGAGLWIARQLAARVDLISQGRGLTVRLWL